MRHSGCPHRQVGSSLGNSALISGRSKVGKRHPEALPPPGAGGLRTEGAVSQLRAAVPGPPCSLFRHVLQLQFVHLQLSPQRQTPPRREDRAVIHVRTQAERGPPGVLQTATVAGFRALPGRCWTGGRRHCSASPQGVRAIRCFPVTVHTRKLGWLPQRPPESS